MSQQMTRCFSGVMLTSLAAMMVCGCSRGNDKWVQSRPPLVNASGVVTINGEPLAEATITLHPIEGTYAAFARTGNDGSFKLTTFDEGDGAVVGEYDVTVTKVVIELEENPINPTAMPPLYHTEQSMVPKKYGDLKKSELTATITAEGNRNLQFDLSGPPEKMKVLADNR